MIIPDIIEIIDHETFKSPIYAGNAIATCKSSDACKIITVRTTAFEKALLTDKQVKTVSLDPAKNTDLARYISSELSKNERPELTAADIVVSGGRGLGSSENFQVLEKLADKLGVVLNESVLDAHSSMALSIYSPTNLADLLTDEVEQTREEKIAIAKQLLQEQQNSLN